MCIERTAKNLTADGLNTHVKRMLKLVRDRNAQIETHRSLYFVTHPRDANVVPGEKHKVTIQKI